MSVSAVRHAYWVHPDFDPVALRIPLHVFTLEVRWYGLMYLVAFALFVAFARLQLKRPHVAAQGWTRADVDDMLFWGLVGVVAGGRLGYVLFYKPSYYLMHPLEIVQVWSGGMSFHGGFLGVLVGMWLWSRKRGFGFMQTMDFVAPNVPLGLAAGRLGNFINGELWGRPTDVPWAMVFPRVDALPRHPSQLYQLALEGVGLFFLLWWFSSRRRAAGMVSAMFLIGYGTLRFIAEFGREPDAFLGLLAFGFSMGQWLSLPMIAAGTALAWFAARGRFRATPAPRAA